MSRLPTFPGLQVRPVESSDELLAARRLHADCYADAGYVEQGDTTDQGVIDDPWVPYSDYFVAIDELEQSLVGTCRIIKPSVAGFPVFQTTETFPATLDVFGELDPNVCIEISALATTRDGLQNTAISAALYGQVWQEALRSRRAYMLAFIDNRLLRIMQQYFHFPFEPTGPTVDYMGSASTPVAMFVPRTISEARRFHPEHLAFFSGDIPFRKINEVEIDLRERVPELRAEPVEAAPVISLP